MVNWKFWKKGESHEELGTGLGLPKDRLGLDVTRPIEESYDRLTGTSYESAPSPQPLEIPRQQLQQFSQNTDSQLVSAKLDTLKAMLEVISQRLTAIEKTIEEKKKMW